MITLRLFLSIPIVEGQPRCETIPEGNFVCRDRDRDREIILNCSFDEPKLVRTVLWNIPESANVDLSNYPGHEVNYSMMDKGSVMVTVNSSSYLRDFYECSIFYRAPRSVEVSRRLQKPLCMCSVLFSITNCFYQQCLFSLPVPERDVAIKIESSTFMSWGERRLNLWTNVSDTYCADFWIRLNGGNIRMIFNGSGTPIFNSSYTLSDLSFGRNNITVKAMANGTVVGVITYSLFTTGKLPAV